MVEIEQINNMAIRKVYFSPLWGKGIRLKHCNEQCGSLIKIIQAYNKKI
jgi:hypothetical protein